jgi:hypothetical protein
MSRDTGARTCEQPLDGLADLSAAEVRGFTRAVAGPAMARRPQWRLTMTTSTLTTAAAPGRIASIIRRQRSSRLRDLAFALALAIGATLSLGALHGAAAQAAAPAPAASTTNG